MSWRNTFSPGQPLRDVQILAPDTRRVEADLAQREQAAYQRGLAEGEKRLSEQLLRQRAEFLELQQGVLASLQQAVSQVIRQSESALTDLALEVAEKLVSGLPVSREMVEAAIRSALEQVEESASVTIHLHPDDLVLLQQCDSAVLRPGPGQEALRFEASAEVTRGGCLVQTRFGIIDASRETKLQLIRESLSA